MNLTRRVVLRAVVAGGVLCLAGGAWAQAPAGSTGQCKDGSYTSAAQKWQACRGHQGVKSWFADTSKSTPPSGATAPAAAPTAAVATKQTAPPASPSTPSQSSSPATDASGKKLSPAQRAATLQQAPGGGNGKVWVNTDSKVYHCEGTTYYGKTKAGQYMTEADAKAAGAKPDHGKACTK